MDSVHIRSKLRTDGVLVRTKNLDSERKESKDEFVSNVIRALRNGHHGYFTDGDRYGRRPSRYLWMVDGNIPDSLCSLPPFWLFGFLAKPKMLGWRVLDVGAYPK